MRSISAVTKAALHLAIMVSMLMTLGCGSQSPNGNSETTNSGNTAEPNARDFSYTTHDALITVMDGPNDDREVTIDTRLYIPENATPENPQPAILVTHGFGGNKAVNEVASAADFYARNGYIVIGYTSQGFGGSSGCVRLDSFDYDVKDSMGLISNMLDNPNYMVDGEALAPRVARDQLGAKVGLVGGSYGGAITLNVAASDPRVRAIVPGRTWNALQYSLMPNNLVVPANTSRFDHLQVDIGVFKQEWTTLLFGLGNAQPAMGNGGCPQEKAMSGDPATVAGAPCPGFPSEICQIYATLVANSSADEASRELIANSSIATRIDQLRVPTMLTQGQTDTIFNLNDATASYLKLKENNVPVSMIWHFPGHGAYNPKPGECELWGNQFEIVPDGCYLTSRALAWFDRWLREDTSVDTGPEFAWFQDWVPYDNSGSAASQYGEADSFPAQGMTRFYLSGTSDMVTDTALIADGAPTMSNPAGGTPTAYTETSNFTSPEATPSFSSRPPLDQPGQFVSFTSAPFEQTVDSVGIPTAHLNLSHINPAQDVIFFGKVFEVSPDGSAELIHRLIAPVRIPADDVGDGIEINLLGFAHRFEAGNSVRLVLSTTDGTSFNAKLADMTTVITGGNSPTYFDLPTQ